MVGSFWLIVYRYHPAVIGQLTKVKLRRSGAVIKGGRKHPFVRIREVRHA